MKIVFCDIDGVLTSRRGEIDKRRVSNLKRIIDSTGSVLVISSHANSFNSEYNLLRINEIKKYGVEPIDSITDFHLCESKVEAIKRWLNKNNLLDVKIVIIDDQIENITQDYYDCFIYVNSKRGLIRKYVNKAIKILNRS